MADTATTPKLISQREAARRLGLLDKDPDKSDPNWRRIVLSMMRIGRFQGRMVGKSKMVVEASLTQFILTGRGA